MLVSASARSAGLVLLNANALTMEPSYPRAEAVAVAGERIAAVGGNAEMGRMALGHTQVIDCLGLTLLPGFNDAHIHLPGLARRLQDLDCGPGALSAFGAPSVPALQAAVRRWAGGKPAGAWVRGHGYDERQLTEGRHPSRWELDAAAPENPVWLEHRSGHAAALNSRALALAGIHGETPDPPGGVIERDPATGEPTGVLFELRPFLRQRLGHVRSPQEFEDGMRAAGQRLTGYGITSVQDAGANNGPERWRSFRQLQSAGLLRCRITMMAGMERLDELSASGLSFGSGNKWLRLGHAKIMLTLTAGALHPRPGELAAMVEGAHRQGFPAAIHCIEEEAIAAAADVLASCRHPRLTDRIEHCAEAAPHLVDTVRRAGAAVVTNPGFLYHNGAAYRENVETRLLPHLYPAGALHRAGVAVAFGSDAPVIDPNPWPAVYSAVTRRAGDGTPLYAHQDGTQAVSAEEALRMYAIAGAGVEGTSGEKGSITPGKLADMVLVNADPLAAETEDLAGPEAVLTIIGGALVWSKL